MSTWYAEYIDDLGIAVSKNLGLPLAWLDYSTATEKLVSQSAIRLWDIYFAVAALQHVYPEGSFL